MRLTWRDGAATALTGFVMAAAFAAAGSWGWPLLGSYRGAIGVLAVAGLAACAVAGAGAGAATKQPPAFEGPLGGVSAVLHGGIAVLVVAGLIVPSAALVLALAAVIAAAWLVGTIHRVTRRVPRARSHGLAA
jgi:hypothetical protein